eukprot:4575044-Pyramimonas_sp.AAC.1
MPARWATPGPTSIVASQCCAPATALRPADCLPACARNSILANSMHERLSHVLRKLFCQPRILPRTASLLTGYSRSSGGAMRYGCMVRWVA